MGCARLQVASSHPPLPRAAPLRAQLRQKSPFLTVTYTFAALVFKSLRLIRPFRVLRLFARLQSLRMLVNAISASIAPVANALAIVMIVIAIYAVLGVSFFMTQDPDNFATFSMAMFTMFQVTDSRPRGVCWVSLIQQSRGNSLIAIVWLQ